MRQGLGYERVENAQVFDFGLTPEDMSTIDALPYFGGSGLCPNEVDI